MNRSDEIEHQTAIRRTLLRNGYVPLANKTKDCLLKGWSSLQVDEALIEEWSHMLKYRATGVRVGGGLLMVDFDIDDKDIIETVINALPDDIWSALERCPVRLGGGVKEAWFAQLPQGAPEFYRIASGAYVKPHLDPESADAVLNRLEVFGASGRQAGVYGAHTLGADGDVLVGYRWRGDGLCEVARADLPVITEAQVLTLCKIVNEVFESKGWVPHTRSAAGKTADHEVFDLSGDMVFETRDYGDVSLSELEALCADGQVRLSASWLEGPAARNPSRCIASLSVADGRLRILETASFAMHRPKELDVKSSVSRLGSLLKASGWIAEDGGVGDRVDADTYRGAWQDSDDKPMIFVKVGDLAAAARHTARAMANHDTFFDYGGKPAVVANGSSRIEIMDEHRVANEIGHAFRFVRPAKPADEGEEQAAPTPIDPPMALVRQVLSLGDVRGLRPLVAVSDVPIMRVDGTVRDISGYDPETRILVKCDAHGSVPVNPTAAEVDAALARLWAPFEGFPFIDAKARGGLLAALLTAVLRRTLPTAPGFAFDAPTQGSGKTLLAQAVGALAGGAKMMTPLPVRNEEEVSKTLLSVMVQAPRAVVFDNQIGMVDSASLATVLTSPVYEGRVLGSSTTVSVPTNALFMLTGNNITLGGDMPRRTLKVRIDAEMETPFTRVFDFSPLDMVQRERMGLVIAALTLVKAAYPVSAPGRVGSFETWDRMVAQTVRWLSDERFADPLDLIMESHGADPVRDETLELMEALQSVFGASSFTARDVVEKINSHAAGVGPIKDVLEGMGVKTTTKGVGRVLKYREGQRVEGFHLSVVGNSDNKHANRYRVLGAPPEHGSVVAGIFKK